MIYITGLSFVRTDAYLNKEEFIGWNDNSIQEVIIDKPNLEAYKEIPKIPASFFEREFPRFSRYDPYSKLSCLAAYQLIKNSGINEKLLYGHRIGIILGTMTGTLIFDIKHIKRILNNPNLASPQIFSFTLPSTALGEIAIYYGISGTNYIINKGYASGIETILDAYLLIKNGIIDRAIVGSADAIDNNIMEIIKKNLGFKPLSSALFFLIEKGDKDILFSQGRKILFSLSDNMENKYLKEKQLYKLTEETIFKEIPNMRGYLSSSLSSTLISKALKNNTKYNINKKFIFYEKNKFRLFIE